jgi:RHH-type proline utilization regulon transcriptional repressor/proline dehydrogenase/delta 1-pyrroline-5-carboxylate dehydrogenase
MRADFSIDPQLIERAIALARELQERATALQTGAERRQQAELDRMLQTPDDKVTLVQLTDQAFRAQNAARVAEQFTHILDVQGVPRFFSPIDRALLRGFQTFGGWLPGVSVPLVREHMQHETANVVLPAEDDVLAAHLRARQEEGLRMNVNFLGESLLGEAEAARRMARYREALRLPEIECLSVKISTIYSQISAVARGHTVGVLCDRLEALYRAAAEERFVRADGTSVPKFVYLDMEEYRDLRLTAEAFMRTLNRPGLEQVRAGIALQAYIPDSMRVLRELHTWAHARVARGGAPITVRIVKGANMEMERVEASLRGWPQATFQTKAETDANFKRMLAEAITPENLDAVRVGVASHNLFDMAFGVVLTETAQAGDRVQFEMLEGMANHQRRALVERAHPMLLYAPACRKEEFLHAIGYLIRRLDENTGPDNFLRHAFKLSVGGEEWEALERGFREAFHLGISDAPRRTQNRRRPLASKPREEMRWVEFANEPDTDFSLPQNSTWAEDLVAEPFSQTAIPRVSDPAIVEQAIAAARTDSAGWRALSIDDRSLILGKAAQELREARGQLIRAAMAEGGKTIAEADPEVSEAVDFVEFYRGTARYFYELPETKAAPRGVIVVVSPWNFPIAIPCGGIAAALAAGNTVILKPATDTALVARELCACFWRAGVPQDTLQFLACSGGGVGRALVAHAGVDAVILTGGTETARRMLEERPELRLFAETGGKNATIVTALADREQAIRHVVHSAFSHGGQKCSATSLLLLEAEVYDDPAFQRLLVDAVQSLAVGPADQLPTRIGPLIRPPSGDLRRALTTLEPGETWVVTPRQIGDDPRQWSPGVKYGVPPGSRTHLTEFFGPLLGVMRFGTLAEAIALVNATGYGLTSGLESLDDREQEQWKAGIRAGNLYLNKPTTGAVVLRQPFGGMGKSCFGPGMKAGGPNYVAQFMEFEDRPQSVDDAPLAHPSLEDLRRRLRMVEVSAAPGEVARVLAALTSYDHAARAEFSREHDHFRLLGEDNVRRYLPIARLRMRVDARDSFFEVFARACAGRVLGCGVTISTPPGLEHPAVRILDDMTDSWAAGIEFIHESDEQLAEAIRTGATARVRFAAADRVPQALRRVAHEAGVYLSDAPVLAAGRVELLWYLREQSVSHAYHRYGNLGARAEERRAEIR